MDSSASRIFRNTLNFESEKQRCFTVFHCVRSYPSSSVFLKHLEAFLGVAFMRKVCAGARERTKYSLSSDESCQEHIQFWVESEPFTLRITRVFCLLWEVLFSTSLIIVGSGAQISGNLLVYFPETLISQLKKYHFNIILISQKYHKYITKISF